MHIVFLGLGIMGSRMGAHLPDMVMLTSVPCMHIF